MGRPKGSKNKTKLNQRSILMIDDYTRHTACLYDVKRNESLCYVCQRVLWGTPVLCGHNRLRHVDCVPGSEEWSNYYRIHRKKTKTMEGDLLLAHCEGMNMQ